MIDNEEGAIIDANIVTAYTFGHASSSQRENLNAIFTSEKLEKSDELVNIVKNMTKNEAGYELNTVTASDAQVNLASNPDTFTHTSNRVLYQKSLSCQTNGEDSVLPPPTNPRIVAVGLATQ